VGPHLRPAYRVATAPPGHLREAPAPMGGHHRYRGRTAPPLPATPVRRQTRPVAMECRQVAPAGTAHRPQACRGRMAHHLPVAPAAPVAMAGHRPNRDKRPQTRTRTRWRQGFGPAARFVSSRCIPLRAGRRTRHPPDRSKKRKSAQRAPGRRQRTQRNNKDGNGNVIPMRFVSPSPFAFFAFSAFFAFPPSSIGSDAMRGSVRRVPVRLDCAKTNTVPPSAKRMRGMGDA